MSALPRQADMFGDGAKCHKRTLLPLDRAGCRPPSSITSGPLIKASFLDGMLCFVTAIAGWLFLPVGCFFRQSKL
jgi:hypothetical protein